MSLQYVIDGYNIINHPKFVPARRSYVSIQSALLDFILNNKLTGSNKNKITVVFDGYPAPIALRAGGDISVVFSRGISADEKIKRMVEESAGRGSIIVVTDDGEIKCAVRVLGARVESIEEFVKSKVGRVIPGADKEPPKDLPSHNEMQRINEELRKLWLE
ncbi:MAG: NYN domain-containing protein [Candidatus Omnitrophota bacterium]|nr:NYN domain-containing protein [Candidatus Omnitrophota bacterium]